MLTVIIGLLAALWLGAGLVIQQHVAATAPWSDVLSVRILRDLIRRPLWLIGVAVGVVGQVLGAIALGRGSLALIEPLLAANLLFALPLAAIWHRRRLRRREWLGAVTLIAGLAGFLFAASPGHPAGVAVPMHAWAIAGGAGVALVGAMVWWARRSDQTAEGTLLGSAAGVVFGFQDALTNRVDHIIGQSFPRMFTSWETYTLVAVGATGLLLDQSAFKAAPLTASLPGLTVAEPVVGIMLGAVLFGDPLNLGARRRRRRAGLPARRRARCLHALALPAHRP